MDSSLTSDAKKAAKQLKKCLPLQRYAVTTDPTNRTDSICGTAIIREGLPITAKVSVSMLDFDEGERSIAEYNTEVGFICNCRAKIVMLNTVP
jgi:hypothetical protein